MNNQLNNIPEEYREFIKLSDISIQYRKFSKGQYIEHTQFNEFLDFFEDQDRLSKVMLQGVGIVCGLKPKLFYKDRVLSNIQLSQGVAITTDGDLLSLNNTSKISEELYISDLKTINIESKAYTHFKAYDNFKVNYPTFYDENDDQIQLWELATAQEATSDFNPINGLSNLEDKYLLLYLESYEKEVRPCRGVDCDNHGVQQIRNLKVLVTTAQGINYILAKDNIQPRPLFIDDVLGDIKQERVILERLILEEGNKKKFSSSDLKKLYTDVLERNGYGETVFKKIYEISKMMGLSVADHLTFKSVLEDCLDQKYGFQYAYDVVKDLMDTYSEIIKLLPKTFTQGIPDFTSFPKHIMLGKLGSETQLDSSRHQFYYSPVLDDKKRVQKVKTLINRFNQQVENFKYMIDVEEDAQIKITPSQKLNSLGNKAIPFYYQVTENFLKAWNFDKTSHRSFKNNLAHNTDLLSQDAQIQKPLEFNIDQNGFYNIEGHQGMDYKDAFEQIKRIRDEKQLGFDIMLLSFDELIGNKDLSKAYFNEYIEKYSGLEHRHGVVKGGTFVMIYGDDEKDKTVVADFSLSYICCTPKVKINLSLPNNTICAKADLIPFTVLPFNGVVTANVESPLDGGVKLIKGLYFFDPTSVSPELHNQQISFSVNGQPTDCSIKVITEPNVKIVVEKVSYPESDSVTTIVKFKVSGDNFIDYQYSWDFLDNGNPIILNPDSEGNVSYAFYNLSPKRIPTIKVNVSGGGCSQDIAISDWYDVPNNLSVDAGPDQTFTKVAMKYGTPVLRKIKNIGSPPNYGAHANPSDRFLIELGIENGLGTDINTCRLYYKKQSSTAWYSDGSSVYNGSHTDALFSNIINQGEILDFRLGVYILGTTTEIFSNVLSVPYSELNNATEGEIRIPDEWIAPGTVQSVFYPFIVNLNGHAESIGSQLGATLWEVVSSPAGSVFSFGNTANLATTFTADIFGTYVLRLSATNSSGQSASDDMKIIFIQKQSSRPAVSIAWADGSVTQKSCTEPICNFTITVDATDPDGDIVNIHVLKKIDNGAWNVFIPKLSTNTFTDYINTEGKQEYQAIAIDASNNMASSYSLIYIKEKAEVSICENLSNIKNARLDIQNLSNFPAWVVATVDIAASAVGKPMDLSHEIYYRRCNDIFVNTVEVLGTKNEVLQSFEVPNNLQSGFTGHKSVPFTYTPTQAGQIKVRISEYSSFISSEESPAHLHIDSQLLFLNKGEVCNGISAEHNFSIYQGADCSEPEFVYTENARHESLDKCSQSKLSFTLTGNKSDVPMIFSLTGTPSGAIASIFVNGDGKIVKQSDGTNLTYVEQIADGDPEVTAIPINVSVNGEINVDIVLEASQSVKYNREMVIGSCDSGPKTEFTQNALVKIESTSLDDILLKNTKIIYV
ncbi:hypothetical protein OF897_19630 [Chryseobacterium formosus]|uniref:PKD domain-containing protein n=1 Tax=Chryseobacterium formosus TaxID=1537363 RepID=A0ABT3XWR7_9FLAO|nr:hypothetical protein [Chryseobacterium formosus]MCX8526130.1 hypothetical protein [Chryseobacterium formosus]